MARSTNNILKAVCTLLILLCLCFTASAEYVIVPYSEDLDIPEELINSDGCDSNLTFWELPLYFKMLTLGALFSFWSLSLVKFLPLLLGKIHLSKGGDDNRQKILSYVSENPGCSEGDVLEALNMKRGTFRYHVGKLELANMVSPLRNGRYTRYFRYDLSKDHRNIFLDINMKNDTRKNVLETIFEEPGVTGKDLSSKLGVDKSTIHWHVNRLDEENVIRTERHGKFKRYYPETNSRTGYDSNIAVFSE
ncbi:winged helix-turn-helix transcriptional regulator [Methanolobus profundi]|uniref:Predicted transcriptional regulator, containsd two HTH domains n=1 Tax=Methanolobus profundi TaxID=487685 RepID=A0A1I4RDE5_9EURY|nr:winged helix-turn-helix transcriptional regulator [Methanolobus profundi]SFM50229.1 Predicted transcriptional regulator, containsd two HTH domains [Methanolobus profundi]